MKKRICVIGTAYAGLANAACLTDLGNDVMGVDHDAGKTEQIKQGILPIYEPDLSEILTRNKEANRLVFTASYDKGIQDAAWGAATAAEHSRIPI